MEYVGELVTLAIDSVIFTICLKQYLYYKNAITSIKGINLYEVGADLMKVINEDTDNKVDYVAIRGIVKPLGEPLRSINNKDITGVIQKLTIKEHVVARTTAGFWSDQERTIQKIYNSVPFVLQQGHYKVEIIDPQSADILDIDVISDYFEPSTPTFSDHLWGFFTGMRQRGLQSTEEMLREGAIMTGVGEISKSDTKLNTFTLHPPSNGTPYFLTNMSISSLLHILDDRRKTYRWLCILFGTIGVVLGGIVIRRYSKDRKEKRLAEELRQSLAASRKERRQHVRDKDLKEEQLCVVCRTNPREIILLPCGHVCLCENCAEDIVDHCPVCRTVITQKNAAYII